MPVPTRHDLSAQTATAIGDHIVTGRRSDDTQVTLGEVFRLVQALKEEHGDKLDSIETQVRITNGRTTKLEAHVEVLNREMRDLKIPLMTPPALPVVTPEGESLSVSAKVSPKMWAAIAGFGTALMVFLPTLREWLEKLLGIDQ